MLQVYHRQTTIKPFAPILKDRSSKRWDSEISLRTNISLLSISTSSKSSVADEKEIKINQHSQDRDSSSSRVSTSPTIDESEEHKAKHVDLDPYILDKHLNGISSTTSHLFETEIDESVNELFDDNKSSYQWQNDDYDPRAIRPPPFSQHMKHVREARIKLKSTQRRSARIPVRTTKAEQLKLARQLAASEHNSNRPPPRSSIAISQQRLTFKSPVMPSINHISHSRTNSNGSFKQSESARSCKEALRSNAPLHLSSMLAKQMRQDIKSNRGNDLYENDILIPSYSKPLNSALLREQPHPALTSQYKLKRVHHWLEKRMPTDYIEYNEYASNESTAGTNFNDKLDDESDLLADEKQSKNSERTQEEARRVLPLFKSEIYRKMRQHNLLLTRLELDLYVI